MADKLGKANPLRYRGYVYDTETGLYYLQSRYYDPKVGRFLNTDNFIATGLSILGNNMFAYCGNNPINNIDPEGTCFYNANGQWCHDNWEYIGGYQRKPDPLIAVKQQQLTDMGFQGITESGAASYVNTIRANNINTPEEEAHFLAQCAYETNFGLWLTELGGIDYFANSEYGYKYRGAGYIHLTWDYNYRDFADAMGNECIYTQGADYVAAHYAWQAAGWWWTNNNMNQHIANGASVKYLTQLVRGSSGTWETRQEYYNRFIGVLG